jgi:hypothetical protein
VSNVNGNPKQLAENGEAIYKQKYQKEYERLYPGKFVAIDRSTENAFLADTPEGAVELLQKENPNSFFHLVKVGSAGVYKVGYSVHGNDCDWLFQYFGFFCHRDCCLLPCN